MDHTSFLNHHDRKEQYGIHSNYRQQFILKKIQQMAKGIKAYLTLLWRIYMVCINHIKYNLAPKIYQILLLPCYLLLIFVRGKKSLMDRGMYIENESLLPTSLKKKISTLILIFQAMHIPNVEKPPWFCLEEKCCCQMAGKIKRTFAIAH